jgi:exosortase A-associated hydrolase 2
MREARVNARFLDGPSGRLFALLRHPAAQPGGSCVLVAPPFADEMNKTRRMLTELADALVRRGFGLLIVDPYGTGDSEGEVEAGDWQCWRQDLATAAVWSAAEGWPVTHLLGVRLGCVLAAEVANDLPRVEKTVFWQPVLDGSRMLEQFLRLRVVASMMEQDRKETTVDLRRRLAAGETLEIAGYALSGNLAGQIDALRLESRLGAHLGAVQWFEIVRAADAPAPAPAVRAAAAASIPLQTVPAEPFWSSVEIVTSPVLVQRTAEFFSAEPGSAPANGV